MCRCPLCHSDSRFLEHEFTAAEAAAHFVPEFTDPSRHYMLCAEILELWENARCAVFRCGQCGSCYALPHVAGGELFYNLIAEKRGNRYPQDRWEFGRALQLVNVSAPNAYLLEIGAGGGSFMRRLLDSGASKPRIYATEYAEDGLAAIRELLSEEQTGGSELLARLQDESVSLSHIFLFHVMEHLDELDNKLLTYRSLLHRGGVLCFSVPNIERINFNERNRLVLDMPPNHLTRFSAEGVRHLAVRNGFQLIHDEVEPVSILHLLREYMVYRFCRDRQRSHSWAQKLEKTIGKKPAALLYAAIQMRSAIHDIVTQELEGGSRLFLLKRE